MCTETHECPECGTPFQCDTVVPFGNRSVMHQGEANNTIHTRILWEN